MDGNRDNGIERKVREIKGNECNLTEVNGS